MASQEARESLTRYLEQVSSKLEECSQATDRQRRSADALEQSLHDAMTQLRAEVEKLHQDLDRCVEELQCKLEAAAGKKAQMEKSFGELQQQTDKLSTFVVQCQQVIDSASASEILRSGSELTAEAKKLVNLKIENDLCSSLRVVFTPTNFRQYLPQTDVNLVGTVSVDDADVPDGDEDENKLFHETFSQNQQKGERYFAFVYFILRRRKSSLNCIKL